MLYKIFSFFVILSIIDLIYGEPNLPDPKKLCPTCVKYRGSIKMLDLYNSFNWVMNNEGIFPDHTVVYRNFRSTPGIRVFYHIKDPLKPVPEPLIDLDLCSMHDLSNDLSSFYQLTTILGTYNLPVGFPCKEAMGGRPLPKDVSKTTYYLIREPTPCNKFNITVEIATLEKKLDPFVTMIFSVTKPGRNCDNLPVTTAKPPNVTNPTNTPKPSNPGSPTG